MIFDYLVIAGGRSPSPVYVKKLLKISRNVVTVDRGGRVALQLNIKPLLHVGDGDSFSQKELSQLKAQSTLELNSRKNFSDLEFALDHLDVSKSKLVVGAHLDHENRSDHSFLNFLLLAKSRRTIFVDEKNWSVALWPGQGVTLNLQKGVVFSIAPLKRSKLFIKGAEYNLNGKIFDHLTEGLSNVSRSSRVTIKSSATSLLFVASDITKTKIDASVLPR